MPRPGSPGTLDSACADQLNTSSLAWLLVVDGPAPPGATMTQLSAATGLWTKGSACGTECVGGEEHPHAASAQAARTTRRRVLVKVIADRLRESREPLDMAWSHLGDL